MTQATERLDIMDTITKFGKRKPILLSIPLAILLGSLFVLALVATGLLVYHFAPHTIVMEYTNVSCSHVTKETVLDLRNVSKEESVGVNIPITEDSAIFEITESTTDKLTATYKAESNPRLPASVTPISYEIYLLPFVFEGNFTFHGNVSILVNITEGTANITLHADELEIDFASVQVLKEVENETVEVPLRDISNDSKRHFLILHFSETLNVGDVFTIRMKFVGILNDLMQGFYRSSYVINKRKRWIAATQFQATEARKAFPCFDEPALKATFQINLGRTSGMSTISNMPLQRTSQIEGLTNYVWDHYEKSIPMSTYLVAFVISDFKKVENGTFSVWARESALKQAAFSLKIGPSILKYYEDFFQIKFPLPKMDMIALPDFSTGAMENWGLITYRESVLLYEKGVSTKTNLQGIAIVVAHELAHQWFGNLVTPVWWSDLWLNEGFASYMEYLGADAVCPELKTLDQFVVQELQNVFHLDALKSSHQISIEVNNPDEINNIFDRISYGKGATIIRMMEHFLSSEVFRRGLTNYLEERKFSNAEQDDLWSALTEQAHEDGIFDGNMTVKEIMDTWTLQTGYPVVNVTRIGSTLTLRQERFFIGGKPNNENTSLWWIPISYISENDDTLRKFWMKAEPELTVDTDLVGDYWYLVNVNQTGYYRVNYDIQNWQLLVSELNRKDGFQKFDAKNRAQMLDDALNLASAGYLDYEIALNVTKYLVHERDYVPWKAAFNTFDFLYGIFSHSSQFDKFQKYMLHLLDGLYKDVEFKEDPNDPTLKIYIRMEMLWRACLLGHLKCIQASIQQFHNWRRSFNPDKENLISPNLRSIVYCNAIKFGSQDDWDFAWQRYQNNDVSSEKELLMSALGCSKEPWILYRYLEWAITEGSGIRKQDSVRIFSTVSSTIIGRHIAYNFLKANWDKIKKYMGSSFMLFTGIVRECITIFPSEEENKDIKRFVQSKSEDLSSASRPIQQLIEQGEANLEWKNRNFDKIVKWLTSFNS